MPSKPFNNMEKKKRIFAFESQRIRATTFLLYHHCYTLDDDHDKNHHISLTIARIVYAKGFPTYRLGPNYENKIYAFAARQVSRTCLITNE